MSGKREKIKRKLVNEGASALMAKLESAKKGDGILNEKAIKKEFGKLFDDKGAKGVKRAIATIKALPNKIKVGTPPRAVKVTQPPRGK